MFLLTKFGLIPFPSHSASHNEAPREYLTGQGGGIRSATLYRHFDQVGRLLYVGISLKASRRLSEHRASSPWASRIARILVEEFPTWADAHAAERIAIRAENPIHNRTRYDGNIEPSSRVVAFLPVPTVPHRDRLKQFLRARPGDEIAHKSAAYWLGLTPTQLSSLLPYSASTGPLAWKDMIDISHRVLNGIAIVNPKELDEMNTFLPPRTAVKVFGRRHLLVDASRLSEGRAHDAAAEIVARHHTKFRSNSGLGAAA